MIETSRPSSLTDLQRRVIAALAAGNTVSAAALAAGIHRSTIHNLIRNIPAFRGAVREGQHQIAQAVEDRLRDLATDAMDLVESYIRDEKAPPAIRLRAALAVIKAAAAADPYRRPVSDVRNSQSTFDQLFDAAVYQGADYAELRTATATLESAQAPASASGADSAIPRSAPCPCGSGEKFKRCCGKSAPPVLGPARAAAA